MSIRNVVLVDGVRSAFARGGRGALVATRLDDAGAQVLEALLARNPKVKRSMIEDVGLGNVVGQQEFTYPGTVQRLAGLPLETCSFNTNRQCGSSMETMHRIAMAIMLGHIDCGIALGIERMGRGLGGGNRGKPTRVTAPSPRWNEMTELQRQPAPDHGRWFSRPFPSYILDSPPLQSMPQTAQNVAEVYDLMREDLDRYAADSHVRAVAASDSGIYADEIVPLEVEQPVFDDDGNWLEEERGATTLFDRDECIRPGTTLEKLAKLPPLRGVVSHGGREVIITAGNSCPTNDGISAAIVMAEERALALGLEPLARIRAMAVAGVKPQVMGLGPIVSSKKALAQAGLEAGAIDRVEVNEAFAAQVLPCMDELGIPEERVNVNGGSIAIGHPLGATGARLVTTVALELRRSKQRFGLATQCIGVGMGISTIVERLD